MKTQALEPTTKDLLSRELVNHETIWLRNFISPQTQKAYTLAFREFCLFAGCSNPEALRTTTSAHIIAYRDFLIEERGLKPRSVRGRMAALSSLFKHLQREQVIKHNPVEHIQRPKVAEEKGATPAMTPEQVRKMLDAASYGGLQKSKQLQSARDRAILHTLFYTACRIAELSRLTIADLFEDEGYQMLRLTVKGGKENAVEVHQELYHALRQYFALSGHDADSRNPLFVAVKGGKNKGGFLHKDHFARIFEKYRDQAGLSKHFTPHSARATFATTALKNGANLEDVQRALSHSHISTTQIYDKRRHLHKDSAAFAVRY